MRVRVLFFGLLKDVAGRSAEDVDLPEGTELRAVFETYAARYPRFREMSRSIVVARNREFADRASRLAEGDEIAFLPPVSGGTGEPPLEWIEPLIEQTTDGGHYFAVTWRPIDVPAIAARLLTGAEGAVVTFEGTARNNTAGRRTLCLDYEGYEPMVLQVMAQIGCEIAAARPIGRIAMVHRLGRLLIGETSVVVLATAPHRRAAFEAAMEGIDRLKKLVPVWKKEHFVDGEVWVEGEWDRNVPLAE